MDDTSGSSFSLTCLFISSTRGSFESKVLRCLCIPLPALISGLLRQRPAGEGPFHVPQVSSVLRDEYIFNEFKSRVRIYAMTKAVKRKGKSIRYSVHSRLTWHFAISSFYHNFLFPYTPYAKVAQKNALLLHYFFAMHQYIGGL